MSPIEPRDSLDEVLVQTLTMAIPLRSHLAAPNRNDVALIATLSTDELLFISQWLQYLL